MRCNSKLIVPEFRGLIILAFVALYLPPITANAQQQEIIELFDEYLTLFNAGDSESIAKSIYTVPTHYAGDWIQASWQSEEDTRVGFDQEFNDIREAGWSKSVQRSIDICVASDSLAFVTMTYSRLDAAGEPIPPELRTSMYVSVQTDDGWRIYAAFDYDQKVQFDCG